MLGLAVEQLVFEVVDQALDVLERLEVCRDAVTAGDEAVEERMRWRGSSAALGGARHRSRRERTRPVCGPDGAEALAAALALR